MVGANSYNLCTKLKEGEEYELYVPLEFWFCRNVGLALPLIALQYHEVKINIEYETQDNLVDINDYNLCYDEEAKTGGDKCTNGNKKYGTTDDYTLTVGGAAAPIFAVNSNIALLDATLWVDYIFLDTDERRRFAQLSHEYLIEQLQFTGTDTINKSSSHDNMKSIRMNFNHPCKELVWTIKRNNTSSHKVFWNNFSSAEGSEGAGNANNTMNDYSESTNTTLQAKIMLNGNDRFATRKGEYFSLVQPYQHHENTPDENHKGINVYSFALKPEEHQPSGTLNMSRIDTAVLNVSSKVEGTIYVFAVNYNVLRILSGIGGLAYSN